MNQNLIHKGVVAPKIIAVDVEKKKEYGSVPGLDDDELADPEEIEQQVLKELYAPIWLLPYERRVYNPSFESEGTAGSNAFASVDFERGCERFNKARYKKDKLKEELKNVLIMMDIIKERLPRTKYLVLKFLRMGIIELEHISDHDMYCLARRYLQARRLQKEIDRIEESSQGFR